MSREILRSTVAVASGWIVAVGGYILTILVFALFNPETFTPGVPLPTGWLLVTLAISAIWSVAAGFVTGVIARQKEIAHVIALALVALIVSGGFVSRNRNLGQVPIWYVIAGEVLTSLAILAGGWLRRSQRLLLGTVPEGAVPAAGDMRFTIVMALDRWRWRIAVAVTFITFVACFWAVVLGAGDGLLW